MNPSRADTNSVTAAGTSPSHAPRMSSYRSGDSSEHHFAAAFHIASSVAP